VTQVKTRVGSRYRCLHSDTWTRLGAEVEVEAEADAVVEVEVARLPLELGRPTRYWRG